MYNFQFEVRPDGVAIVTFDMPHRSMNMLDANVKHDLNEIVDRVVADSAIKGVVITSGKASNFCVGGDLDEMFPFAGRGASATATLRGDLFERQDALNQTLRRLETCGKPVVSAINGLALGGGLELALATHYRISSDAPAIRLGFPEAKVGLMPGAGGTQRLPRLIGVEKALPLLLEDRNLTSQEALDLGVIDAIVPHDELVMHAVKTILDNCPSNQPWDRPGYQLPKGGPYGAGAGAFINGAASVMKRWHNNYPGRANIARALYEGVQVPFDAGVRVEARYFVNTLLAPQAQAMIRSSFQSMRDLKRNGARKDTAPSFAKASVLGAGMMGAGIAYSQAKAGIKTVLLDVTREAAEKGKDYSRTILRRQVETGQISQQRAEEILACIEPTDKFADTAGSDVVIEAVFEDRGVKAKAIAQTEVHIKAGVLFGSNTSTLPITSLAETSRDPANFIGLHFFSPVDRMDLVEIICGAKTSESALATAVDYVVRIGKTPIVVNDSRGFYTSRCFETYICEGAEMLLEGIAPEIIDNVGRATGMPRGPLELMDDVAIDLVDGILRQARIDLGAAYQRRALDTVVERMTTLDRRGRKNAKGFYDYHGKAPKKLWAGLRTEFPVKVTRSSPELIASIRQRLLYRQALEAARCIDEGVVRDVRHADVGALLGWGFAPWTGGPVSMMDTISVKTFVEECDLLAQMHGPRFASPPLLRAMADERRSFYSNPPLPLKVA